MNKGKPCIPNRYAFTGREWDPDIALYHYRARWYDPDTKRFTQEEPVYVGFANSYIYANNSPIEYIDPSGLESESSIKDKAFAAIEMNFPGVFTEPEKEMMLKLMVKYIGFNNAIKLQSSETSEKEKQKIIENAYNRAKIYVEKKGTDEEKALLDKTEIALKKKKETEKKAKEDNAKNEQKPKEDPCKPDK